MSGDWKRHDGTPQESQGDGYATGLITFALQQAGLPLENPQLKKGLAWLTANQNRSEGFWLAYSLNNNDQHHISPGHCAGSMKDAATAYAVLSSPSSKESLEGTLVSLHRSTRGRWTKVARPLSSARTRSTAPCARWREQ